MLTDEDLRKLKVVEDRLNLLMGADDQALRDAYFNLLQIVKNLSRSRPDEYAFPTYAGLINDINCTAFALKIANLAALEQRVVVGARRNQPVFEHDAQCHPTDALMVVRPWVRVIEPTSPDAIERLSASRITLAVDGDSLLQETSLRDHLVGPGGYGLKHQAFSFKGLMPLGGGSGFFRAAELIPVNTTPGIPYSVGGNAAHSADGEKELGFFLPNGSKLTIDITHLEGLEDHPATVMVGLVAAVYSTAVGRALPKRKQDWSPRDP